jgi:hypothetical protein
MTAQHEDDGMQGDQGISEIAQGKLSICEQQDRQGNHEGHHFQNPGETRILDIDAGPGEKGENNY